MTGQEVIDTMNNAWRALVRQYKANPGEDIQCALNLLAKICNHIECAYKESEKRAKREAEQITIEEWIAFLSK